MSFELSLLIPLICIANAIDSNIIINSATANICNYQTNLSCQNCTQEFVPFMNKCEGIIWKNLCFNFTLILFQI
jgi:hypothetical protein